MSKVKLESFFALAFGLAASWALGGTATYVGKDGGNWDEAANWQPSAVPDKTSDVVVAGKSVRAKGAFAVASLTVGEGGTVVVCALPTKGVDVRDQKKTASLLWDNACRVTIAGPLTVKRRGRLVPENDPLTGTPVVFTATQLTVEKGGLVDASGTGWQKFKRTADWTVPVGAVAGVNAYSQSDTNFFTYAFGAGTSYTVGAGHGSASPTPLKGWPRALVDASGREEPVEYTLGGCYGLETAPFLPGSPSGAYNPVNDPRAGGGSAILFVTGEARIDGTILADAKVFDRPLAGGASGGSIWLAAARLCAGPSALLAARGGRSGYPSEGGGGRIAVTIGATADELSACARGELPSRFKVSDLDAKLVDAGGRAEKKLLPGTAKLIAANDAKDPVLAVVRLRLVGKGSVTLNGKSHTADADIALADGGEIRLDAPGTRFFGTFPEGLKQDALTCAVSRGLLITVVFPGAAGVERRYVGPADGSWEDEANWSPRGVPSAVDTVVVSNASVKATGLASAKDLKLWFGGLVAEGLSVDGALEASVGSTVWVAGPVAQVGGDVTVRGSSLVQAKGGTISVGGRTKVLDAGTFGSTVVGPSTNKLVSARPVFQDAGWTKAWWFKRFQEKCGIDAARKRAAKVVFLGDSITHHWEFPMIGGPVRQRHFDGAPYQALFYGYQGDRTQNLLWRIVNGELDGTDPKAIVVMIGTNNNLIPGDGVQGAAAGVRAVLDELLLRFPKATIVLHPTTPVKRTANDPQRASGEAINRVIRSYADGKRIVLCDFNAAFLQPDGSIPKELMDDAAAVHPTTAGYEIWAAAVKPVLDKILK